MDRGTVAEEEEKGRERIDENMTKKQERQRIYFYAMGGSAEQWYATTP